MQRYHLYMQKGHFMSLPYLSPGELSLKSLVQLWAQAQHPKAVLVMPRVQAGSLCNPHPAH